MKREPANQLDTQVGALSELLFDWRNPGAFSAIVDQLGSLIDLLPSKKTAWHRQRKFRVWREAWVLKSVLPALNADWIRLRHPSAGQEYDASIRRGEIELGVEVTEAVERSRFPTSPDSSVLTHDDDIVAWRETVAAIPGLLRDAARRKSRKAYASQVALVVYLNCRGTYGIANKEIRQILDGFVDSESSNFEEVHVLWGDHIASRPTIPRPVN